MVAWWESLSSLEHMLLYLALPATLVLLLQTVFLLVGGWDGADTADDLDADGLDLDGDGIPDEDLDGDGIPDSMGQELQTGMTGLHVFTVRGITAFLALFGWGALWLCQTRMPVCLALFLALQIGAAGMFGMALLIRQAARLQYDGTLDLRNAVGRDGDVYLTVPAGRSGYGKVNVMVQEQLREFVAQTDGAPLPTGTEITVTGLSGQGVLIVREKNADHVSARKKER